MYFGVFYLDYEVNIVDKIYVIYDNLKKYVNYLCFVLVFYFGVKIDC